MGFAYATINRLTSLAAAAFTIPTGAGPLDNSRLYLNDGRMDRQYNFTGGTTTEVLQIDLGSAKQVSGFAILNHNLAALGGGDVEVRCDSNPAFPTNTLVKTASNINITTPNDKDAVLQFANTTARYWRLKFNHVSSSALKLGEVYAMGVTTTLARFMVDGSGESEEIFSVGTKMLNGETRHVIFGGPLRSKTLRWQDWTAADLAELRTMWRATRGPVTPFIFIQSYESTSAAANYEQQECVFGRLMVDTFTWTYTDHLLRQAPEVVIMSLGREAGA